MSDEQTVIPASTHQLSESLVTVVMVMQNDQDIISDVINETVATLKIQFSHFEILIIDNGSTDRSVGTVKELQESVANIRLLLLSRTYDEEIGFAAGLDNSIGDFVVLMDIRYDPPSVIPQLLASAQAGNDVVIAERKDRSDNTVSQKFFAHLFYKIYGNISGFYFSPNASNFRVLGRRAVNSIIQIKNKSRYLKYFNALVGFSQTYVSYDRVYRKPIHRPGLVYSVSKAFDVIIYNTVLPLRLASLMGVLASGLNLIFLVYVFLVSIFKKQVAEGWVSTSATTSIMFLFVFIFLSVISEYIARILSESKDQPLYFVAEEFNSKQLSPVKHKINVV